MLKTLYARLSVAMLTLFVLFLLLNLTVALRSTRLFLDEVNQRVALSLAGRIAAQRPLLDAGGVNEAAAKALFSEVMAVNPLTEVYLLDPTGRILASSPGESPVERTAVSLEPIRRVLAGGEPPIPGDDPRDVRRQKVFSVAVLPARAAADATVRQPDGYLYVILGGEQFQSIVGMVLGSQMLRWGLWLTLASLLCASAAGVLAFRYLTRPLRALQVAMSEFRGPADRSAPASAAPPAADDIAHLAATFDHMKARIDSQVDELRRAETQRRELIANVSHDLRTPLTSLHGYLETLELKERELGPAERRRYLALSLEQSRTVSRLVTELLELAQLESGEPALVMEPFSACDLVQDVVQKFGLRAQAKQIALTPEFPGPEPLAEGDIPLIERLLDNLIDNALRHTPVGGFVTVRCEIEGRRVVISVRDNGPGITAGDLPHLFDRHYRGEGTATREGAGLGLAIGKRIAELHGSELGVANLSPGAQFTFSLPLADATPAQSGPDADRVPARSGRRSPASGERDRRLDSHS